MNSRSLDPRRIPNNFRLQTYIDEETAIAKELLDSKLLADHNSSDLADIALICLESGNWKDALAYSALALKAEEQKTADAQDKEVMAIAHYITATRERESNHLDAALAEYDLADELAQTDWLKSNIYRNRGLVYLKDKNFVEAAEIFEEAVHFTASSTDPDLRGSLPALYNYWALTVTRAALAEKQDPARGLELFERTTALYATIFAEKHITALEQLRSHDWQSHQFHRGMVLCEIAEQEINEKGVVADPDKLKKAQELLLGVLQARIANRADDQRLGDVCVWLGRIFTANARVYLERALGHYTAAFPGVPDAMQLKDVRTRLAPLLPQPVQGPATAKLSVFTLPSQQVDTAQAVVLHGRAP